VPSRVSAGDHIITKDFEYAIWCDQHENEADEAVFYEERAVHRRRWALRRLCVSTFEDSFKTAIEKKGFTVARRKRINRKEFDVVAVGQVIYNIQCKNNLVDLSRVESDTARFARYNQQLDRRTNS
jgi:hypothetical protein